MPRIPFKCKISILTTWWFLILRAFLVFIDQKLKIFIFWIEPLIRSWSFEKVNAQHITMYSMFILGSIVEILMYHGANLPAKLDQVCGVIAFGVEAFIFANHLHGRSMLDTTIHVYLVYSIYGCVLFSLAEVFNSKQVLFTYGRILFTILQGT